MSVDRKAPADKFAEIESALDARVLAALAAAWKMAVDRDLVVGVFWSREKIAVIAEKYAESITWQEAAQVAANLNGRGDTLGEDEILDAIWSVIA